MGTEAKSGGKPSIRLFAPSERDIEPVLAGLDEAISVRRVSTTVDAAVAPAGRTDLLLQRLTGDAPPADIERYGLDPAVIADHFSTTLDSAVDLVILSAASDIAGTHYVHRTEGWIISPPEGWEANESFLSDFDEAPLQTADEYASTMREVISTIRNACEAHIVLFGASTLGEELVTSYAGHHDDHRMRTNRINAAQIRLSMMLGVSVVDVDRVIANVGGREGVLGPFEYSSEAIEAIADEVAHVIADMGFFDRRPLVPQVGQEYGAA